MPTTTLAFTSWRALLAAPIIKSLLTITIGAAVVLQLVNLKTSPRTGNE